ncbi:hypothetical protein diail_3005 [Diaporthe ilicicola]|nr:hypothetical protein diail_3005 [Diaporthe ilicicola]
MAAPSRLHLTSPAVDYIDNRLQTHDPVFIDPPTYYDLKLQRYVTSSGTEAMSTQRRWNLTAEPESLPDPSTSLDEKVTTSPPPYTFPEIMQEFKETYLDEPKGRCEKDCSIRSKSSWEEVLEVLASAAQAYFSKSGIKGKVRRAAQFIGDRTEPVQRLTALVPEIEPCSKPVVDALKIVLEAFKRTSKVRETVKEGVENLTQQFDDIDIFCNTYSGQEKIAEAAMTLNVSILKAVEDVIGYYTKHIVIKGLEAAWNGNNYEESLLSCLEKVNENGKKLNHEAKKCHFQEGHEVSADVKAGLKRQDSIREAQNELRDMFEDYIRRRDIEVENDKIRHNRQMELMASEIATLRSKLQEKGPDTAQPRLGFTEPLVNEQGLLDFLNMRDLDDADLDYIMQLQGPLTSGQRNRSGQIMKSTKFSEWLVKPTSQELLIHGNSEPNPVSPISFFCGMLVQSLRGVKRFHTLSFFCGRHPEEDYGGGRTMIMSLLAQLLQQQHFDLGFIGDEDMYHMGGGNVEAFCFVFEELIRQIDVVNTVFCVIDGINFYERGEEMLEEMAYVMRFLLDLTKDRTVFKILITSPSTTEDVRQAVHDSNYISLPREAGELSPFSKLWFERQYDETYEQAHPEIPG